VDIVKTGTFYRVLLVGLTVMEWYIVQGAVSNSCLYIEAVHCTGYCQ